MHKQSRLSGQFNSCLFIMQYFLINEGICVTSYLFCLLLSCLFNGFALKCLLRSIDMHKIDHTFLFLSFLLQSSWGLAGDGGLAGGGGGVGVGGCVAPACSEPYIYMYICLCQRDI